MNAPEQTLDQIRGLARIFHDIETAFNRDREKAALQVAKLEHAAAQRKKAAERKVARLREDWERDVSHASLKA